MIRFGMKWYLSGQTFGSSGIFLPIIRKILLLRQYGPHSLFVIHFKMRKYKLIYFYSPGAKLIGRDGIFADRKRSKFVE